MDVTNNLKATKFRRFVYLGLGVYGSFAVVLTVVTGFDIQAASRILSSLGLVGALVVVMIGKLCATTLSIYKVHCKYEKLPGPKRESFYGGNYYQMRRAQDKNKLFVLLRDWSIEHGDTYIFWRHGTVKWFTTDPDVIRSMLTEITTFSKAETIPNRTLFGQRITGNASFLTVTGGKLWAQKRKVMSPYFTKIHMSSMFGTCKDYIERGMEKQMGEVAMGKTPVDLVEFYGELFQFFLGALGFDMGCEYVSKNAKFHNKVIQRILKWVPLQLRPYHEYLALQMKPEVRETVGMIVELRKIAQKILDAKQAQLNEKNEIDPNDILHHVIQANTVGLDDPEVDVNVINDRLMDDVMTIFLVIDNMAKTLSTFFVRVMRDERIYKKVAEEARAVDTSSLKAMDQSLRFTEMVILECLRLYPTLMRGIRVLKKDTKIKGLEIKSRHLIFFGQLVLHRNPKYWDKPDEFIPERFETGTKNITPFTYLPFVAGPRVCMGKHLAMLSMKLAIVNTLKNYDLRPPVGEENDMDWDYRFTIVRPTKGHYAIIEKVDRKSD